MKRYLLLICALLYLVTANAITHDMNIYIGANYLADDTIKRFEKICNCHLTQNYFNDPEEMIAKIAAGATGYNIIIATSYTVEELAHMGKIQKLDLSKIPNFKYVDPKFLHEPYDPQNQYSLPYAYTPVFLAYNMDKMKTSGIIPNSWAVLFEPKYLKKLKGHITVFNSSRNVFAVALLYLHKNPNSTNPTDLQLARRLIDQASPYWTKFDSDSYYRGLLRGDIWLSMAYSIDIYKTLQDAKASGSPIKIGAMLQKEGNMYELDNMVIPVSTHNLTYSYQFINTALDPQSEYELANVTGSSVPSTLAIKRLKRDLINTQWIYPKDMHKMWTFTAYDPATRVLVNEMWTEILMECHY
ncbi:MAG: spermidine/putrescine ABC transporter substrate-binding protein [Bacteroidia bacterium]|nr:MAG: spermidine/putrescine ABC transporter substrate-binding protein [Bacteroidia bacterium]